MYKIIAIARKPHNNYSNLIKQLHSLYSNSILIKRTLPKIWTFLMATWWCKRHVKDNAVRFSTLDDKQWRSAATHNCYFTNGWLMLTTWLSDESAIIWSAWWWIGDRILCGPWSVLPHPHPHPIHTLRPESPVSSPAPRLTHVWWLAGRRVTLQTRYFLRMVPQCVTSTFKPGE